MKDRRSFIRKGALLASAAMVSASVFAKSESEKKKSINLPGLVFTEESQGKWEGKAGSHVPIVTVNGNKVTLLTAHGMSNAHYIVRHTLVDKAGTMIGSKTFSGDDGKAESTFELPTGFSGKLYATSFCNKHDFWVKEFDV